ncbi:MAG: DUF3696 domain-containing protein [Flavobacterium sp.]
MNIKDITIENFKCFKSSQKIEFGKLTFLTGPNSSGKSSIIYSVLGAIQSEEFPFRFSTNGKYVDMGDFKEIAYRQNKNEKITLGFTLQNNLVNTINTVWKEDRGNNLPLLESLQAITDYFTLNIKLSNKKYIVDFSYNPDYDPQIKILNKELYQKFFNSFNDVIDNISDSKTREENVTKLIDDLTSPQNIKNLIVDEIPFSDKHVDADGTFKLKQIIDYILKLFTDYDNEINFISSFRLRPERTYLEQAKSKIKVDSFGDGYLDQIIIWEAKNKTKFNELIDILKNLGLLQNIKSKRLEGGRYEITVQITKDSVSTSLSDVGFGVSQFLPIIVADLQLPNNSTLYIAQPEIHLHPSIQSHFGGYLINQINKKNKKYVIETHSEYLLNSIRLGVVKGEIKEEDIKVYFIDGDDTTIHNITFNKKGQIKGAPDNFFKTYMMDVMEIAINAAE